MFLQIRYKWCFINKVANRVHIASYSTPIFLPLEPAYAFPSNLLQLVKLGVIAGSFYIRGRISCSHGIFTFVVASSPKNLQQHSQRFYYLSQKSSINRWIFHLRRRQEKRQKYQMMSLFLGLSKHVLLPEHLLIEVEILISFTSSDQKIHGKGSKFSSKRGGEGQILHQNMAFFSLFVAKASS